MSGRVVSPGFRARVETVVRLVPPGMVATYGDIAAMLGSPRVARHVGWALAASDEPELPWHRILNVAGAVPEDGRGPAQRARLAAEGIGFLPSGRVDMRAHRWLGSLPTGRGDQEVEPET